MKKISLVKIFAAVLAASALTACGGASPGGRTEALVSMITKPVGCSSAVARDHFWQSLYDEANEFSDLPAPSLMARGFQAFQLPNSISTVAPDELSNAYSALYTGVYEAATSNKGLILVPENAEERRQLLIQQLAEMELGDRTTPEKEILQNALDARFARLENLNAREDIAAVNSSLCSAPIPNPTPGMTPAPGQPPAPNTDAVDVGTDSVPLFQEFREKYPAPLSGAYKVMSVGYQSCNVLDPTAFNAKSPNVAGITKNGTLPNGGVYRSISSVSDLMKTNPYYYSRVTPSGSCFTEQKNPLIYDYGGKPAFTSAKPLELNLYSNAGTGSPALGIDCSGYISSALLVSGLRLKSGVSSKVAQTHGVSATMMMGPEKNGLSCLSSQDTITAKSQLLPGDIIAQSGHVVMVDSVGADPFGISAVKTAASCTSANLPYANFNFTITQSSPSKGGIGMNRYRVADYLATNSPMRGGLMQYAIAHCKAKFGTTATIPTTATAKVVRHKGTASCKDVRIEVKYSSCLKDCARRG